MLNIVIPMAGKGSRFSQAGYKLPKPLIDVNGKHMIEVVINNLKVEEDHRFIFVCTQEHVTAHNLEEIFSKACNNFEIVIATQTSGAAIAVLDAREFIDNDQPLMIANSDQWIEHDINLYLKDMKQRELAGSMLTMKADDPKWSYAKLDENNLVTEVVEKKVISDEATVGIYNFSQGALFCQYADYMIERDIRHNGEFYVAPVYTFMAMHDHKVGIYNIGEEANGMYGLGIPQDLELFLKLPQAEKATNFS